MVNQRVKIADLFADHPHKARVGTPITYYPRAQGRIQKNVATATQSKPIPKLKPINKIILTQVTNDPLIRMQVDIHRPEIESPAKTIRTAEIKPHLRHGDDPHLRMLGGTGYELHLEITRYTVRVDVPAQHRTDEPVKPLQPQATHLGQQNI